VTTGPARPAPRAPPRRSAPNAARRGREPELAVEALAQL